MSSISTPTSPPTSPMPPTDPAPALENDNETPKDWMELALSKAEDSLRAGEVPVGCLFIYKNEVIATGNNTVNETKNATRHAEINCIDNVMKFCEKNNLNYQDVFRELDVVVTVEPCVMCAAALHELEIRSIVYGCPNDRFGGCGSVFDVSSLYKYKVDVTSGINAERAMKLLKEFYQGANPNVPLEKMNKKRKKNKKEAGIIKEPVQSPVVS
uniref:CMP/dCMP-type deaminase domain-containing protein n=1 Tax=Bracon brevicornis TaxID=1563983 RepID=A0A6V7L103_9HYME